MVQDGAMVQERSGAEFNASRMALDLRRGVKNALREVYTMEPALVTGYDIKKQTVTLIQMNMQEDIAPVYRNVPIIGDVDSDYCVIRPIRTVASGNPTTGLILFPKTDSRKIYGRRQNSPPYTPQSHGGHAPLFLPGFPTTKDTPHSIVKDTLDENNVSPGDYAIIHKKTGSHFIMKDNGDIILRAAGNIYMGSTGSDINNMTRVDLVGVGADSKNVYTEEA